PRRGGALAAPDWWVTCPSREKTPPPPPLYPADPAELAEALFLEEYADTRMNEVTGGIFFERFVKVHVFRQAPDEARVQELLAGALPPVMEYLESQLPDDRDSALSRFGIADASLGVQLAS